MRFFQFPTIDQSNSVHGWLFGWIRLHTIFVDGRNIPIAATQSAQLHSWLIQSGCHVYRYQNVSLFGARK